MFSKIIIFFVACNNFSYYFYVIVIKKKGKLQIMEIHKNIYKSLSSELEKLDDSSIERVARYWELASYQDLIDLFIVCVQTVNDSDITIDSAAYYFDDMLNLIDPMEKKEVRMLLEDLRCIEPYQAKQACRDVSVLILSIIEEREQSLIDENQIERDYYNSLNLV